MTAHRESFESNPSSGGQSTVQDYNINLKLFNKLQKRYLAEAIIGTQWTAMSPTDGFFLAQESGSMVKVKIPQSQTVINVNPNQFEKLNLEIIGQKANYRMEQFMDSMCKKLAAT